MKSSVLLVALFISVFSFAQDITQTIRGTVSDSESNYPLFGTKIKINISADKTIGAISDDEGNFVLTQVPVGKHTVIFTSVGYESKEVTVIVTSGKKWC